MTGPPTFTCDTSLLVPALTAWHPDHAACVSAIRSVRSVAAHVLLETYSVLTRLPAPHRIAPQDAGALMDRVPLSLDSLAPQTHRRLLAKLGAAGVRGGATYDALIAATALEHGHTLLSRDRRARTTYDAVGADYRLI